MSGYLRGDTDRIELRDPLVKLRQPFVPHQDLLLGLLDLRFNSRQLVVRLLELLLERRDQQIALSKGSGLAPRPTPA